MQWRGLGQESYGVALQRPQRRCQDPFQGDPEGRPTKDEMVDYLQTYADHFALPIQLDTRVVGMEKHGETFLLQTTQDTYQVATVIVATGPFHHPRIPAFVSALSQEVQQLHSSSYHNPSELPPGPVLVVGNEAGGQEKTPCKHYNVIVR
jgi:putative flavoprotein involved in K+ transport